MPNQAHDAIALLTEDHEKVKSLFEQFDKLSDRSTATKKKLADQICHALTVHTQLEEQVFYPAVRNAVRDDDLMDEAQVEHDSAKDLIDQLQDMDPGDALYDAKIKVLSEQIEHHIGEEESDMFPKARNAKLDLSALAGEMSELRTTLETAAGASRQRNDQRTHRHPSP